MPEPVQTWALEPDAGVTCAARLLEQAREVARADADVRVDGSAVTKADLATVQVLVALERAASVRGRRLRVVEASEALRDALTWAGAGAFLAREGETGGGG